MKRAIISSMFALVGLAAASAPALAQYYPYPPQGGGYYRQDPYGRWSNPGYGGGYGGGWGGGYYQRPVRFGNVCLTSRGSCPARPRPEQSPCTCIIPGFGPKRGGIIASGW
ncbi:MAG: hypothetical protein ACRCTI_16435 [Beijerinckiaceae bacterium]